MATLEKQQSLPLLAAAAGGRSSASSSSASSGLRLSGEYCAQAEAFAAARVSEALRRLAAHHAVRRGVVDRSKWRLVQGGGRRNPIACYRRVAKRVAGPKGPDGEVLAVGAVAGSVEDLLHGLVNLSPEAMQVESAAAQRDLLDARVLGVARAPTADAPLRSLALKWALRNHEELGRPRDYVFLEATGLVDASALDFGDDDPADRGAKKGAAPSLVGYHLVHSLRVPGAPRLAADMQVVRGSVSYCALFRPRGGRDLELFFRGHVHPRGGARASRAFQLAADTALATPLRVECGLMKKLAFALRTRAPKDGGALPSPHSSASDGSPGGRRPHYHRPRAASSAPASQCAVCRRSLRARLFGARPPVCELCDARACGRCRVAKRVFVVQGGLFHPAKMDFCSECVAAATELSAAWVAAQELAAAELGAEGGSRSSSLDSVDQVDVLGGVRGDEDAPLRLTMTAADALVSRNKQFVWLPSDRTRPTLLASSFSPPDAFTYEDADAVGGLGARLTGKEGASGPPDGLFVPNESEEDLDDAIPMIDMPSDGEDDDREDDREGPDPARFHRKDQPQTDLSYLY